MTALRVVSTYTFATTIPRKTHSSETCHWLQCSGLYYRWCWHRRYLLVQRIYRAGLCVFQIPKSPRPVHARTHIYMLLLLYVNGLIQLPSFWRCIRKSEDPARRAVAVATATTATTTVAVPPTMADAHSWGFKNRPDGHRRLDVPTTPSRVSFSLGK